MCINQCKFGQNNQKTAATVGDTLGLSIIVAVVIWLTSALESCGIFDLIASLEILDSTKGGLKEFAEADSS